MTETWLYDGIDSESVFDETYVTYRADRTVHTYEHANNVENENPIGGGALIAIKKISSNRLGHWEREVPFDNIWIKINTISGKKIFINCIYINPSTKFDRYNQYFQQLNEIVNIREPNASFIIIGDFNLPCIEWYPINNRCIALNHQGRHAYIDKSFANKSH